MNYESGFGSNGAPFEYSVDIKGKQVKLKKIGFIGIYALWVVLFFVVGILSRILGPLLCFIPITTWILIWLTWKYTQVSYQYSFFKGDFTVLRVFGEKKKKQLCKIRIKDIVDAGMRAQMTDDKINEFAPAVSVFAASSDTSENLFVILGTNEKGEKIAVYFDVNDKAKKIIRYYNSELLENEVDGH